MLGQTSTGENKFTAEKIEENMMKRLQEDFNTRYKGGTGSGWEFYMNKLKEYGKSWDDILTSWKRSKAGKGGFGYDPVFISDDFPGMSLAEISEEQKNSISHRGKALRAMAEFLADRNK